MLLSITTEYETIYLSNKENVSLEKINLLVSSLKEDLKNWHIERNKYLKENNLNEKRLNDKIEDIQYKLSYDRDNPFLNKMFNDLNVQLKKIYNYHSVRPRPDFLLLDKLEKLGFNKLSNKDVNINIQLKLEEVDIDSKFKVEEH